MKRWKNVWNAFKVDNKDTRTTSALLVLSMLISAEKHCYRWKYFTKIPTESIIQMLYYESLKISCLRYNHFMFEPLIFSARSKCRFKLFAFLNYFLSMKKNCEKMFAPYHLCNIWEWFNYKSHFLENEIFWWVIN